MLPIALAAVPLLPGSVGAQGASSRETVRCSFNDGPERACVFTDQASRNGAHRMMKAFHHPGGNQPAFLTGLVHLYNLVPYQRRAQHAGQCGVEVEGGIVPTRDWFLNVQILTSGGFR